MIALKIERSPLELFQNQRTGSAKSRRRKLPSNIYASPHQVPCDSIPPNKIRHQAKKWNAFHTIESESPENTDSGMKCCIAQEMQFPNHTQLSYETNKSLHPSGSQSRLDNPFDTSIECNDNKDSNYVLGRALPSISSTQKCMLDYSTVSDVILPFNPSKPPQFGSISGRQYELNQSSLRFSSHVRNFPSSQKSMPPLQAVQPAKPVIGPLKRLPRNRTTKATSSRIYQKRENVKQSSEAWLTRNKRVFVPTLTYLIKQRMKASTNEKLLPSLRKLEDSFDESVMQLSFQRTNGLDNSKESLKNFEKKVNLSEKTSASLFKEYLIRTDSPIPEVLEFVKVDKERLAKQPKYNTAIPPNLQKGDYSGETSQNPPYSTVVIDHSTVEFSLENISSSKHSQDGFFTI